MLSPTPIGTQKFCLPTQMRCCTCWMTYLNFLTFVPRKQVHINSMYITRRHHKWLTTQPTLFKKRKLKLIPPLCLPWMTVPPTPGTLFPKPKGKKWYSYDQGSKKKKMQVFTNLARPKVSEMKILSPALPRKESDPIPALFHALPRISLPNWKRTRFVSLTRFQLFPLMIKVTYKQLQ